MMIVANFTEDLNISKLECISTVCNYASVFDDDMAKNYWDCSYITHYTLHDATQKM